MIIQDARTVGQTDRYVLYATAQRMDGWMDGWMDVPTDKRTDR